ncbi:MAG: hypothetical protein KGY75_06645 [Candidatus Cloacimonetes bacterium]|nr:hypothetical protein [Candidatus Cloacimonadota bacterium]
MKTEGIPFIPEDTELTSDVLKAQEESFKKLLDKIMKKADEYNVTIRVIGSLAFRIQCPDYKYIEYENKRYLTDIDFIAYSKEIVEVDDMFRDMGWEENMNVLRLFGDKRRIFYHPNKNIHSDVFIDKLRFCHDINFKNRLEIAYPTISLVDLLLEKLQIVKINKKDLVDIMVLLSQYQVSDDGSSKDVINGKYVAKLCSKDWGWWKTATTNIEKAKSFTKDYLDSKDKKKVSYRLDTLSHLIGKKKKTLLWKLRSLFGEKISWYREVEEVERD